MLSPTSSQKLQTYRRPRVITGTLSINFREIKQPIFGCLAGYFSQESWHIQLKQSWLMGKKAHFYQGFLWRYHVTVTPAAQDVFWMADLHLPTALCVTGLRCRDLRQRCVPGLEWLQKTPFLALEWENPWWKLQEITPKEQKPPQVIVISLYYYIRNIIIIIFSKYFLKLL